MEKIIILDNKKIKIDKKTITIGRSSDCDITLNDDKVSRVHGKITKKGDDAYYNDNNSSNGSYLNNKLVTSKRKIKEGDVIQIGTFVLKIDLEIPTRRYPALETGAIEDGVECSKCGKTVSAESKFCVFCGEPVKELMLQESIPCPVCGKQIPIKSNYCHYCGNELAEETYDLSEITPVYMSVPDTQKHKPKSSSEAETIVVEEETIDINKLKKEQKKSKKGIKAGKPAGFWLRSAAAAIDLLICLFMYFAIVLIPTYVLLMPKIDENIIVGFDVPDFIVEISKSGIEFIAILAISAVLLSFLYLAAGWASRGTSIGKSILSIYVFDFKSKTTPITWGKAIIRYFSYYLSVLIILIGFIIILFRKDKRGLHDIIAGTSVCHKK